ncbi:MAG: hypothetical protein ACOVLB_07225 [Candidatus Nanopelagicus sp.]
MNKGFVIMAQNTKTCDYIKCAKVLSDSIKRVMPNAEVTIITTDMLPYGDLAPDSDWKLINDWQVYDASPYEYTIKLEADMIIPTSIEYWWEVLEHRDLVVSSTIRTFKGEIATNRFYRQFIDNNNLPDVYNAITYFKKSQFAKEFFDTVKEIFNDWESYKKILKCNIDEIATTDWAYALACNIHGHEETTMPIFSDMSMVHMKQHINNLMTNDWTDELVYEILPDCLRVNTFVQQYPFHYHVKNFASIIEDEYA